MADRKWFFSLQGALLFAALANPAVLAIVGTMVNDPEGWTRTLLLTLLYYIAVYALMVRGTQAPSAPPL
jgi:hypothetical protein